MHLKPETSTPVKKAPMPLPQQETMSVCRCKTLDKSKQFHLNNYDTPKTICPPNIKVSYKIQHCIDTKQLLLIHTILNTLMNRYYNY